MFEIIVEEVKTIDQEIVQECAKNNRLKELYLGTQIFLGPFYEGIENEPTILFIGINPSSAGGGEQDENGKWHNYKEMTDGLQYIAYGSVLGNNVIKIFGDDKRYLLEDSSSKINCYPFATKGQKELEELINILPSILRNKIRGLSKKWVTEIVKGLNPLLIFCEGKFVFNFLQEIYTDELKIVEQDGDMIEAALGDREILVPARKYSNFLNQELCKERIKKFCKEYGV